MRWRKVTLLGVGLLGGSLGLALRRRALAETVAGYVRRESGIAECLAAGAVDSATCDLSGAVRGADLIVLCTPLCQMGDLARKSLPAIAPGTIVTDVGSVKQALVDDLEPLFAGCGAHFIGSHPMAGSEKMGVAAASADLFANACCAVTPTLRSDPSAVARIEELWSSVGGHPMRLEPGLHDRLAARSSHLPHVLAAHLAGFVLAPPASEAQKQLCAGGFKDSTRVASGSPEMWRDIALMNRTHLSTALQEFSASLGEFLAALGRNDSAEIESFFRTAKTLRDDWRGPCLPNGPE